MNLGQLPCPCLTDSSPRERGLPWFEPTPPGASPSSAQETSSIRSICSRARAVPQSSYPATWQSGWTHSRGSITSNSAPCLGLLSRGGSVEGGRNTSTSAKDSDPSLGTGSTFLPLAESSGFGERSKSRRTFEALVKSASSTRSQAGGCLDRAQLD